MFNLNENRDRDFQVPAIDIDVIKEMSTGILDKEYLAFIKDVSNGGFFFEGSLHLYGFCKSPTYHNIKFVNSIISYEYGKFSEGLVFFGQEALGNQFAFTNKGIAIFNIETAGIEIIAKDFNSWLQILKNDLEYLTARNLLISWKRNEEIRYDQRLCAKKPFIIGGEYSVENLYPQFFPTYLSSNANIAKQIHDLPDGTEINIKITE